MVGESASTVWGVTGARVGAGEDDADPVAAGSVRGAVPAPTVDDFSFTLRISCATEPFIAVSTAVGFFLGSFSSLSRAAFSNLSTGAVDERVDVKGSERGTGGASVGVSPRPGPRGPVAGGRSGTPGVRGMLGEGARKLSQNGREALRRRWCFPVRDPLKPITDTESGVPWWVP